MWRLALLSMALVLTAGVASAATITVGAGSSIDLGTGLLGNGCHDLVVAGTLDMGGTLQLPLRDVEIDPGGVLNSGTGILRVSRDWDNAGTFNAGPGNVQFVEDCGGTTSVISGSSTFGSLFLFSNLGRIWEFEAGSTSTVLTHFGVAGLSGNLIGIRSTTSSSEAFLDVQGTQNVTFVDVDDNHAVGDPIIVDAASVVGANADGWQYAVVAVPVFSLLGLITLVMAMTGVARRRLGWTGEA